MLLAAKIVCVVAVDLLNRLQRFSGVVHEKNPGSIHGIHPGAGLPRFQGDGSDGGLRQDCKEILQRPILDPGLRKKSVESEHE
jgi:hypothetical protein